MVQAITSGKKVQTRRIIKPHNFPPDTIKIEPYCHGLARYVTSDKKSGSLRLRSPYGYPESDKIWVRETYANWEGHLVYKADVSSEDWGQYSWKPAIHMPKSACRLVLSVSNLQVQRLGEISEEDAVKEGVCNVKAFRDLWIQLNGEWEPDIWVWVVDFTIDELDNLPDFPYFVFNLTDREASNLKF